MWHMQTSITWKNGVRPANNTVFVTVDAFCDFYLGGSFCSFWAATSLTCTVAC